MRRNRGGPPSARLGSVKTVYQRSPRRVHSVRNLRYLMSHWPGRSWVGVFEGLSTNLNLQTFRIRRRRCNRYFPNKYTVLQELAGD